MTHVKDESLSAFIDGEVDENERALIQAHLDQCTQCFERRRRLVAAGAALASIPEEPPTADQTRALRQALLARRPTRWLRLAPAAWAAAGGAAILFVAFVMFATLRRPSEDKPTAAPQRAVPTEVLAISGDPVGSQRLVTFIQEDAEIKAQVGKYRVSDVRSKQEEALADFGAAGAPAAASAQRQAESAQRPASDSAAAASPLPDRSLGYCLRAWVKFRPNPTIPITGRRADFQGQAAWLLVYAYSPTDDPNAPLDHLTILVVRQAGCERDDALLLGLPIRPSPTP
jgi:hypothetical protein